MKTEYILFRKRADRSKYIAERFKQYIGETVLDVGCDQAVLRSILGQNVRYTGIDIGGNPDIAVDLENIDRLRFADSSFDTVICSDVLEHLDNLHQVFNELARVTRKYLIISLPNNWTSARKPVRRGKGNLAHYGLPIEKPADRHKWFFNFSEAEHFVTAQQNLLPISLVETISNERYRPWPILALRRLRYSIECYRNRYTHTLWAVYKRD